ncbi:DNA helicase-2/ATP-dependent DNA helicase PcrA [Mobiluncus mulieris]|nr:DNA helicase-2/ATP-dependent DNA helicase PcrA [Mobiluncus mulieris]
MLVVYESMFTLNWIPDKSVSTACGKLLDWMELSFRIKTLTPIKHPTKGKNLLETPRNDQPEMLLEQLDPSQREVATHQHGALCVLAGAGTGKTRAITYRIAYGVRTGAVAAENILALSFTQKAAGEMRERLTGLGVPGVETRTFHSAALAQARFFWPQVVGGEILRVMSGKASLVTAAAARLGLDPSRAQVRDLAGEIEWAKVSLLAPDEYVEAARAAGRMGVANLNPERIADLAAAYEEVKAEAQALDFEDILLVCAGMLDEREDVLRAVQARYQYFVVDEYQDVSPLQNYLLLRWLGHRRDLAVVGDAAQTIYSFAGATPSFLTDFTRGYPEAKVVELTRDYRSTPQVVGLANQVLADAKDAAGRPLGGTVQLVSQREDGPDVQWFIAEDDQTEASTVAKRSWHLMKQGTNPKDIAILFRTNSQAGLFGTELARMGLPYVVKDQVKSGFEADGASKDSIPREAITLASLHSAKGLEWEAVFLVGASEGLLPINLSTTDAQIEEERRLTYVGITRARSLLTISYAKGKRPGASGEREACRFLAPFWARPQLDVTGTARHRA